MGCGRRLCCIRGSALRSAQPRSDPEPARGAASPPPLPPPGGQLLQARRSFDLSSQVDGFPVVKNFASVPTSISASLPLPSRLPHPVGARAHNTHSHLQARVRTPARPESRRLQRPSADPTLSGAATHTGFQPPRGVLCLRQRRRREPQLQPGPVSQLRARDGVRERRRGRTPRRGGAAPGAPLCATGCLRSGYRGPR